MRSFINPNVINKNSETSPASFSTFMTGRKGEIGGSVLNSARNNIVNFNRARVTPLSSDIPQVLNSISTNVINNSNNVTTITQKVIQNVNSSVNSIINGLKTQNNNLLNSIQKKINTTLNNLIQNFTKDYQKRVQSLENSRPFEIIKKFLSLYKNAIDFISFFSNEKNVKRIQSSLRTLRRIFDESFNVALFIRQIINKIVRQLSNLPTASGNAPDLNLDLKVPGGPLKQSGSRLPGMARNIALVGAGVAGTLATQKLMGGMGKAQQIQEEKLKQEPVSKTQGEPMMPEGLIEGLERIIDNFSNAVSELIEFAKKKPTSAPTSAAPAAPPPGEPISPGAPGSAAPIDISGFSEQDKMMMGKMIAAEVGVDASPEDAAAVQNVMLNRLRSIKQGLVSPQAWGISGKTKEEITLSDVLSVESQWQPLVDGAFQRITEEQWRAALNKATLAGGTDPNRIRELGLSRGLSEIDAEILATAVSFYNPRLSSNTPFPGQRYVRLPGGNLHEFGRSPNVRLSTSSAQAYPYSLQPSGVTGIQTSRTGPSQVPPSTTGVRPQSGTARPPTPLPPPSNVLSPPPSSGGPRSGGNGQPQSSTNIVPINIGGEPQSPSPSIATQSAAAEGGQTGIAYLHPLDKDNPYEPFLRGWAYNINTA